MLTYIIVIIVALLAVLGIAINIFLDKKKVYTSLIGKHVVVTGGSSGIGKAAALEAANQGASVTIVGRNVAKLEEAVLELQQKKSNGQIQFLSLDVTSDFKTVEKFLVSIEEKYGPIFMLVNCAGYCVCGQFENMKVDDVKGMMDLNYFGTAYPTMYVLPGMKKRREGSVVFVSTEAAFLGIYGYSGYSASKWAVRGLAECLFMELIGSGVSLTLAFPPDTDTPGYEIEELSKPKETKLISGTGGLHSAESVGKKIILDAMERKNYIVFGFTGTLMSLLYCNSIESVSQVMLQIFSMGFLRMVMVTFLLSFYKIVRDGLRPACRQSSGVSSSQAPNPDRGTRTRTESNGIESNSNRSRKRQRRKVANILQS